MPKSTSIPARPLTSFIKGGLREYIFNLAYDALDSLEAAIIRLRNLEAFALDMRNDPQIEELYIIFDIKKTANYMRKFQVVEQLIDEPLFSSKFRHDTSLMDVSKFDSSIGELAGYVEADISRLEGDIVSALGKLPDEIPSGKIRAQLDVVYQEVANLYGSSELPSLVASFEGKSKDEVFEQAKDVLKTLQSLLDRAKSLALECILCDEKCFNDWEAGGLGELLDRADHMFLLQQYIDHFRHDGQAITKFMAGQFDRSATRLDYLLRAYILCYKDIPKESTPIKLGVSSLQAAYKDMYLQTMSLQSHKDTRTLKWLLDEYYDVESQTPGTASVALRGLLSRVDIGVIKKRQIMATSLRKRTARGCYYVLGADFVENAYSIFHGLIKADVETLEKLNSDIRKLNPSRFGIDIRDATDRLELIW